MPDLCLSLTEKQKVLAVKLTHSSLQFPLLFCLFFIFFYFFSFFLGGGGGWGLGWHRRLGRSILKCDG